MKNCRYLLLLLIFGACEADKSAIVQEKVDTLVQDYYQKHSAECRADMLAEAERIVDSLLLTEAQQEIRDSLNRLRPGRPVEPPAIPPIDTARIAPLFDK